MDAYLVGKSTIERKKLSEWLTVSGGKWLGLGRSTQGAFLVMHYILGIYLHLCLLYNNLLNGAFMFNQCLYITHFFLKFKGKDLVLIKACRNSCNSSCKSKNWLPNFIISEAVKSA